MKRSLVLTAAIALALGACATTPAPEQTKVAANDKPPSGCVGQTATRIPVKDDKTCAGPGSTFTKQDLERTGEVDPGRALQMLDPAITRH